MTTNGSAYGRMVGPPLPAGMSHGGAQTAKTAFDEGDLLIRHMGLDISLTGDSWVVHEWTRDEDGNVQVRNVSQGEFYGLDSGNQYTGGQDF